MILTPKIEIADSSLNIRSSISCRDLEDLLKQNVQNICIRDAACDSIPAIAFANIMKQRGVIVTIENNNFLHAACTEVQENIYKANTNSLDLIARKNMLFPGYCPNLAEKKLWKKTFIRHFRSALYSNICLTFIFFMFVGLIMVCMSFYLMEEYGSSDNAGFVVTCGGLDIFVPILSNIILLSKVGVSTTSRIQYMRMQHELLALKIMTIDIDKYLLNPMLCSFVLISVILNIISTTAIILGGLLAWILIGKSCQFYLMTFVGDIKIQQIIHLLFKAVILGYISGLISCAYGVHDSGAKDNLFQVISKVVEYGIISSVILQTIITLILLRI